jgi:hypothetical protein
MDRKDENKKPRSDQDLPGYPHYPPEDDIMNPQHGYKKISADEELANSRNLSSRVISSKSGPAEENLRSDDEEIKIVRGTEADVTKEDLALLGDADGDIDLGDDELVHANARVDGVEEEAELDVPGAELDDDTEELGEEDEENNYYSLGGDRHENLEEDQS